MEQRKFQPERVLPSSKQRVCHTGHTELDFWKRYYAVRVLGESWDEAFPAEYENIVVKGHQLAPYLALFLSSAGMKYATELRQLLAAMSQGQTQRERELKSVAESAIRMSMQQMGS